VTASAPLTSQKLPQLDPLEVSSGMIFGRRRSPATDQERQPPGPPRATLETILLEALHRTPCVVAFSGGRDSSAMLAETTRVARAHGLEDPVPHTVRFGSAPRTDEEEWQELVIRHLGLENWSRRTVTDELDALGPIGLDVLHRYGVHWPPNIHADHFLLEPAPGGSLVTGNGGDELLVPWVGHRVSLLRRGRALPGRYDVKPILLFLLPQALFVRRAIRRGHFRLPWLRSSAAREVQRLAAIDTTRLERSWARELDFYLDSRYLEVALEMTSAMARDADVKLVEPFFDPRYIESVCADAPPEGYSSRKAAMERLFGDLLPPAVVGRSSKAIFTEVFCGSETRRFAEEWTGSGVDHSLVDPEALRDEWLSPVPDLRSLVLIQAAWLASA
jgi:asparagine synthase (glutamine-hydrolysing)